MGLHVRLTDKLILLAALVAGCLSESAANAVGRIQQAAVAVPSASSEKCPSHNDADVALSKASALMSQSQYQAAAAVLEPVSEKDCDARISLLLAAAAEGEGDSARATALLQHAHSVWPANNSIAASLAREYLASKELDKAVKALAQFHATAETPEQETEMAALVFLAAHQLAQAQTVAEAAYKYHPSVHTLLLLANTLQMQGRYPDVNRLLGNQRETYANSPEFFVTLAESEFDASLYPAAREDLQRAISLNPSMYQAHYLLGNVLSRLTDLDGAIVEYHRAIELSPLQPRTYFQLALVLRSKQDPVGEQHALEQALAADGNYSPAQCEMGALLLDQERPTDAVSYLTAAVQSNPRYEKAYLLLAKAYAKLGETDKRDQMVQRLQVIRDENRLSSNGANENNTAAGEPMNP
jgi:tetratricopeptide (TPR) repeat protein